MTTTATPRAAQQPRATHFGLAMLALAMGGFAIGTTEFVTMGLLPQIAAGVDVSIPSAGHLISAYALGVVVGAPVLAFYGARLPRRALLISLMAAYAFFNLLTSLATSYRMLTVARFLDGLPHGAYFGAAALVAASLAPPDKKGRAVASVMLGLSVANVVGVPAATWMGQSLGWRSAFLATTLISLATIAMIWAFVPATPGNAEATGRRELQAFRNKQVWLTLLAGSIGFGGLFAVYTFIAKTVTDVGGLGQGAVPVFLLAFGLGMVVGTWFAGELAAWGVFRALFTGAIGSAALMVVFWFAAPHGWWALPVVFLITGIGSLVTINLQLRLMDVSGDAQTIGANLVHACLNLANALGAWLGGVVIAAGYGYRSPALVGAVLSVAGIGVLAWSLQAQRRTDALDLPALQSSASTS
ncbi:MAG: MFS transporter [Nocardioides sp.]|nr:MFS transporter [Nocardioides sp.]